MPSLHLIDGGDQPETALRRCLERCGPEDGIVLVGAAVRVAVAECGQAWTANRRLYARQADLQRFGIEAVASGIEIIDDAGLVRLTVSHQPCVSWL